MRTFVFQSSTAEHSGELEEVLIVTQTETPLNDVDVGSGSLVDADAAQSSLGTGVEASLLHADIGRRSVECIVCCPCKRQTGECILLLCSGVLLSDR